MVNYDVILNLVSIVLVLLILFMILFGCKKNGRRYYERFENDNDENDNDDNDNDNDDDKTQNKEKKTKKTAVKKNSKTETKAKEPIISGFEKEILEQLSSGQLTTEAFTNLITTQQFTQQNLENMINYVENAKGIIENKK